MPFAVEWRGTACRLLELGFCANLTAEDVRETDSGFPQMVGSRYVLKSIGTPMGYVL
jgi:hypothetical protein